MPPGSGQILQPLRGTVCEEDVDFLFLFQSEAVLLSSCWKLKGHLTDYVTVSEASYSWECQKWSTIFETNRIYIEKRKPDIYRYSIRLYLSWKDILPWSLYVHVDKQCFTFIWLLVKECMLIKSSIRDPVGRTKLNASYNGRKIEVGICWPAFSIKRYVYLSQWLCFFEL